MVSRNIYQIPSVQSLLPPTMLGDLVDFIASYRNFILDDERRHELFKTRFSGHSVLSDIVQRLTVLGKHSNFSLLKLPTKTVALREAIDMTFVPFDLLQIKDQHIAASKTLSIIPQLSDKLLINITDITKASGEFSHVTEFQNRVVRDVLSRSYYTSYGSIWISPALVRYIAKVYSMTIGGTLERMFNLSALARSFVQTVFCIFYVGKMVDPSIAATFVKNHAKFLGLHDTNEIRQILDFIKDTLGKDIPESLEDVCKVIDAYDHGSLKTGSTSRLNRSILNMKFASLAPEGHTSMIALEYPPYFLYLILQVLSGARIGLSIPMKGLSLVREGQDVIEPIIRSSTLYEALS